MQKTHNERDMTRPLLTIVTVCFNAAATLQDTLASIVQRPDRVEYVVIDGGSTDETLHILEQHSAWIDVIVSERDNGIFDAMNKGFRVARGEYIAFLNADDSYVTGALAQLVLHLEFSLPRGVLYADWIGINQAGIECIYTADHHFYGRHRLCHQAVVARRSIFPPCPFDLRYKLCADFDLLLRWQQERQKFEHLPLTLVRFSETGASARLLQQSAKESIAVAIRRARFPWAQLFSVRVVLYVLRAALLSNFRQQSSR